MAMTLACPECGTAMREIVWGFGTLADVRDVGDVVIGGCVVDVDTAGRVAVAQCPSCGTRADADGVALERSHPAPVEHPFDVSFSSPPSTKWEVGMPDGSTQQHDGAQQHERSQQQPIEPRPDGASGAPSAPGTWRDHVEPYSSRDDQIPPPSVPTPERVDPYSSRDDALPERGGQWHERVEPFAGGSEGAAPGETLEQGASYGDETAADAAPGDAVEARPADRYAASTSDFTDAEEEGWPPSGRDDW